MKAPWRTSTVVELCRQMRADHDFGLLPILADALEDADYSDQKVLKQCRSPKTDRTTAERLVALLYSDKTAAAVKWLDGFVEEINKDLGLEGDEDYGDFLLTYPMLVDGLRDYLRTARGGEDDEEDEDAEFIYLPMDTPQVVFEKTEPMWKNFKTVTGADVKNTSVAPFRCAC